MRSRNPIIPCFVLAVAMPTVVALASMQLGCAPTTQTMRSGAGVPASQGTVRATGGDHGNTNLALRVRHLASPSMVAADATVYVVWVQPRNAPAQNVGALTLNDNLDGSLDTVTPHRQFQLKVTPEPSGQVAQPTNDPVFTATVDRGE